MPRPPILIGCTGWAYDDWVGPFYASGTPASAYLEAYSRVFRFVEVDSSFHHAPPRDRIARWAATTPAGFTLSLKLPRTITHDAKLRDAGRLVDAFVDSLEPLRRTGKLGPLVAQMPPSFSADRDEDALFAFLEAWPAGIPLAVELRNASWWRDATYELLRRHGATLVWSVNETGRTPPVVTSDRLYVRVIGDRALDEKGGRWTHVQREAPEEIAYWSREVLRDLGVLRVFLVANNHFLGYAPETAQRFAQALGQSPFDLAAAARPPGQRALGDFGKAP